MQSELDPNIVRQIEDLLEVTDSTVSVLTGGVSVNYGEDLEGLPFKINIDAVKAGELLMHLGASPNQINKGSKITVSRESTFVNEKNPYYYVNSLGTAIDFFAKPFETNYQRLIDALHSKPSWASTFWGDGYLVERIKSDNSKSPQEAALETVGWVANKALVRSIVEKGKISRIIRYDQTNPDIMHLYLASAIGSAAAIIALQEYTGLAQLEQRILGLGNTVIPNGIVGLFGGFISGSMIDTGVREFFANRKMQKDTDKRTAEILEDSNWHDLVTLQAKETIAS